MNKIVIFLLFVTLSFEACNTEKHRVSEEFLIEYSVPFFVLTDSSESEMFYGIETQKFTYIRNYSGAWLLYDKRFNPEGNINLCGLDEYIFVQSDLEVRLSKMIKVRNYNLQYINLQLHPWSIKNFQNSE